MEEELIEAVRNEKCLYDITHPDYLKIKLKQEIWSRIAYELHIKDGKEAKRLWEKLRNCHREALRRRNNPRAKSGSAIYPRFWRFQEDMAFLVPYMADRITNSYLREGVQYDEESRSITTGNDMQESPLGNEDSRTGNEERNQLSVPIRISSRQIRKRSNRNTSNDLPNKSNKEHEYRTGLIDNRKSNQLSKPIPIPSQQVKKRNNRNTLSDLPNKSNEEDVHGTDRIDNVESNQSSEPIPISSQKVNKRNNRNTLNDLPNNSNKEHEHRTDRIDNEESNQLSEPIPISSQPVKKRNNRNTLYDLSNKSNEEHEQGTDRIDNEESNQLSEPSSTSQVLKRRRNNLNTLNDLPNRSIEEHEHRSANIQRKREHLMATTINDFTVNNVKNDPLFHFFISMYETTKRLPPLSQLTIKTEMFSLVSNEETKNLMQCSSRPHSSNTQIGDAASYYSTYHPSADKVERQSEDSSSIDVDAGNTNNEY